MLVSVSEEILLVHYVLTHTLGGLFESDGTEAYLPGQRQDCATHGTERSRARGIARAARSHSRAMYQCARYLWERMGSNSRPGTLGAPVLLSNST
jgi:hypothetical protein